MLRSPVPPTHLWTPAARVALALLPIGVLFAITTAAQAAPLPNRPQGPCDIYALAGTPCVAAHSTTRALYASYDGPLYQLRRLSDEQVKDIGVVPPTAGPFPDAGGYADAAVQDVFCANTTCLITKIYDQSPMHNDLTQPPRGGFSGPAMGGFNNLPIADMATATLDLPITAEGTPGPAPDPATLKLSLPDDRERINDLGIALFGQTEYDGAREVFRTVTRIDPKYVDVIVARWEKLSGKTAERKRA